MVRVVRRARCYGTTRQVRRHDARPRDAHDARPRDGQGDRPRGRKDASLGVRGRVVRPAWHPGVMMVRGKVLDAVATAVAGHGRARLVVGVDGADGVGKTVFADALALTLGARGRPVVRVSLDGFHHPRAVRYRRGRDSAEGCYLDSFDLRAFEEAVVTPIRAARRPAVDLPTTIRTASFDHRSETPVHPPPVRLRRDAVVLVDGVFLHRPELVGLWDLTVLLVAPVAVGVGRMGSRDGTPRDPDDPWNWRYVEAQRLYREQCDPERLASIVIDNTDVDSPRMLRERGGIGDVPDAPGSAERAE